MKKISCEPKPSRFEYFDREKWNKSKQMAERYLAEHPRPKYYRVKGYSDNIFRRVVNDETMEVAAYTYLTYTDEEVKRMKELLLKVYNSTATHPAKSYDEMKTDDISELCGKNKELDKLLWKRAAKDEIFAEHIDLDNPLKFTEFQYIMEDNQGTDKKSREVLPANINLTDEQYVYLLTEVLYDCVFTFMTLVKHHPEFAEYLAEVAGWYSASALFFSDFYNALNEIYNTTSWQKRKKK
jgi:hypothetical protein